MVRDLDGLGRLLDDQHRVALVARPQEQGVAFQLRCRGGEGRWCSLQSKIYVTSVSEDPRWRDQRRGGLAAGHCFGRAVKARGGPEPDLERTSRAFREAPGRGGTDGRRRPRRHSARSLICIAHASAILIHVSVRTALLRSGEVAPIGARHEGHGPLREGADVRLERVRSLESTDSGLAAPALRRSG